MKTALIFSITAVSLLITFDQEIDGNTPFTHIAGAGMASLKLNLFF